MKKIGIGITTLNRHEILTAAVKHFEAFAPKADVKFVVVDDSGVPSTRVSEICSPLGSVGNLTVVSNAENSGVSFSKNECLRRFGDRDYVFMFDDDCFPQKEGWADLYTDMSDKTKIGHFNFLPDFKFPRKFAFDRIGISFHYNCGGALLFMTRKCIDAVGAYDLRFGKWGFEHAQWSKRAAMAGFSFKDETFVSIIGSDQYIYSVDWDYNDSGGKQPPLYQFTMDKMKSNLDIKQLDMRIKRFYDYVDQVHIAL